MRIAICEDNCAEADTLAARLPKLINTLGSFIEDLDKFANGSELLTKKNIYDLIFIDCRLPDMTGTELAKMLRKNGVDSEIIFVTAFNEYAVEGYECGALRYLIKPISDEKLSEAIRAYLKKQNADSRIDLKNPGEPLIIKQSEIYYIEAVENRSLVRLREMDTNSRMSLADFEKILHYPTFFRTSRQFIVNMRYIEDFVGNEIFLRNCSEHIKVSRRNINEFRKRYKQYLTSNFYSEDDEQ